MIICQPFDYFLSLLKVELYRKDRADNIEQETLDIFFLPSGAMCGEKWYRQKVEDFLLCHRHNNE